MNKFLMVLQKIMLACFVLIFIYILSILLFVDRFHPSWFVFDELYYRVPLPNFVLLLIEIAVAGCIYFVIHKRKNSAKMLTEAKVKQEQPVDVSVRTKKVGRQLLIASVILFVVQLIFVSQLYFEIGFDVYYMKNAAEYFVNHVYVEFYKVYLEVNPNNVMIYFITICFDKLGMLLSVDGYKINILFGIILANLSVYLTGKVVFRLTSHRGLTWMAYGLAVFFIGLSPWIMAPYSDIYSVVIPIMTFDIYLMLRPKKWNPCLKVILVSILPVLGSLIKPTNLFILFGIMIVEVLMAQVHRGLWKQILAALLGLLVVSAAWYGVRAGVYQAVGYVPNEEVSRPMMHYALIGSDTESSGNYNYYDDQISDLTPGKDAKIALEGKLIKERYLNMGCKGYLYHLTKKNLLNYNNAILGWGKEYEFAHSIHQSTNPLGRLLQNIYYPNGSSMVTNAIGVGGKYFAYYILLAQFLWMLIMSFLLAAGIYALFHWNHSLKAEKKDKTILAERNKRAILILSIVMIGIFVFLSIFETNARYLFSYLPMIILFSSYGAGSIFCNQIFIQK